MASAGEKDLVHGQRRSVGQVQRHAPVEDLESRQVGFEVKAHAGLLHMGAEAVADLPIHKRKDADTPVQKMHLDAENGKTDAYSHPMTPAPRMARDLGRASSSRMVSES